MLAGEIRTSFSYSRAAVRKRLSDSNRKLIPFLVFAATILSLLVWSAALFYPLFRAFVGLICVTVFLSAWSWFPSVFTAWYRRPGAKQIRDAERRAARGERFDVTRETLTVWQEGEKRVIPWADVIGYDDPTFAEMMGKDTVRIRTVTGKEFTFTSLMEGAENFARMLSRFAPNAVVYRRGHNEYAALGGIRLRWTGGEEGKGDQVFHRRTRKNLYALAQHWVGPLAFLGIVGPGIAKSILLLFGYWSVDPAILLSFGVIFLIIVQLALLGGIAVGLTNTVRQTRSYLRDRVIIGKEGIRVIKAGKEKVVRWDAVAHAHIGAERVSLQGVTLPLVTLPGTGGDSVEFIPLEYAYGNELPDLIREHLARTNAEATQRAVSDADVSQSQPETRDWTDREMQAEQQQIVRRTR